ncbi:DHA1 family inner membrane transport protein [Motilibacter peucedani]|uniref:DHA1 family inner membrane transport protein n=1 Tax=Motilibacter peucedani TaxID=598650 RepID=A0A420XTE5_9ACTN|nr:MFS transporter [Motilibacter peucedani]RKS80103.1 DHA1 family inner membrane transport protein [Motilibacter peucedani]
MGDQALEGTTGSGAALGALAAGTFAIGVTEFVVSGLLPEVADDLDVSISRAGLLVSGYAMGVVVGAPLMTMLVLRLPRRWVLVGLLGLFVAGNAISAASTTFVGMMAGRVVAALCHGAFIGIASLVATSLVAPERKSQAIATMLTGLTVANVAGVPLGTLVGQSFGWRTTFWTIAALGLLAMAAVAVLVPDVSGEAGGGLRTQLRPFARPPVWAALTVTALGFGAVYAPLTYVAPLMTDVAGYASSSMSWLLAMFGVGLVLGNLAGARLADLDLRATVAGALAVLVVVFLVFDRTSHHHAAAAVTLFVLGMAAFATVPAFTTSVLLAGGAAADNLLASSAAVAAFNVGNATGAWLGGVVIDAGHGYAATTLVGAAMSAAALGVFAASLALRR